MSRLVAVLLRKMPTTSVRRLISLFSRSSGLLDQICRQWATGKAVKARMSGPASARCHAPGENYQDRAISKPLSRQTAPTSLGEETAPPAAQAASLVRALALPETSGNTPTRAAVSL
jgi:hypothetical protein